MAKPRLETSTAPGYRAFGGRSHPGPSCTGAVLPRPRPAAAVLENGQDEYSCHTALGGAAEMLLGGLPSPRPCKVLGREWDRNRYNQRNRPCGWPGAFGLMTTGGYTQE